jgi:osmotically-inducible protein OsmY
MKTQTIRKPIAVFAIAAALVSAPHAFAANEKAADVKPVQMDNTAVNKRDAKGGTVTPMDQLKGTALDTEITRKIREQITKDANFSTYAKNVKIITLNKSVTLRGPVTTDVERTRIGSIAQTVAGPGGAVVNELEIAR